ncbi:MAG: YitT family protein [Oscillospiraceae bacterium]
MNKEKEPLGAWLRGSVRSLPGILTGALLVTGAYSFLVIPAGIVNGGVTSLGMSLARLLSLPASPVITAVTLLLILCSYFFLSRSYFRGGLIFSVVYLILLNLFSALNWQCPLPLWCCTLLGGLLLGVGNTVCMLSRSTTLGADTIALMIHTKLPRLPVAGIMYAINLLILLLGLSTYGVRSALNGVVLSGIQAGTLHLLLKLHQIRRGTGSKPERTQ